MRNDFSQQFEIIYEKYCSMVNELGATPSILAFSKFLKYTNAGKPKSWKNGQPPSANDCKLLNQKLGFSLDWLLTGKGEMLCSEHIPAPPVDSDALMECERRYNQVRDELHGLYKEHSELYKKLLAQNELLSCHRGCHQDRCTYGATSTNVPIDDIAPYTDLSSEEQL